MHINYQPENKEFEQSIKNSLYEKFWQLIRFVVVTGMIFVVSFLLINFSAYKTILMSAVNPDAQAAAEDALSSSVGVKVADSAKLIDVLPTKRETRKNFSWINMPIAPTDDRLIIPKIGKNVPLIHTTSENLQGENWPELEKQIQKDLRKGVVHYPGTAHPGQIGNVFMTGHSSYYPWDPGKFKDVFALLEQLEVGDRFYVYYHQKKYSYQIFEKFEVQPSRVDVLSQPKDQRIATLMSCIPVGTTLRRLILRARQIG